MYYFVDKQEKSQIIPDSIMNHFYDMGKDRLAYAGLRREEFYNPKKEFRQKNQ